MQISKPIVAILIIQTLAGIYFEVADFYLPYWISDLQLPDAFEAGDLIRDLFRYTAYVCVVAGVVQMIRLKRIELLPVFKFPLILAFAGNLFWFITCALSTEYSFFDFSASLPWYAHVLRIINYLLIILSIAHFSKQNIGLVYADAQPVSRGARSINWLIDLLLVLGFGFSNLKLLARGFVFDNVEFLNNSASWFFFLFLISYYLLTELLFLQTLGKLRNNSFVTFNGNRFTSILFRTLGRCIPFDALSFFGKRGWHDAVSNTGVSKAGRDSEPT